MSQIPELQQAYQMIKAGQRQEAGMLLKNYLSAHPKDVDGWWLMAHAANNPEIVQKCLERVLQLNPDHAKAKERLARTVPAAPAPTAPPPAVKKESAVPDSFEAFAAQPLTDMGADDPFAQPVDPARPKPPKPKKGGPRLASDDFASIPAQRKAGVETVIGWAVLAIALVVLFGGALYIANDQGWLHLWGDKEEHFTLVRMDGGSFTMLYPKGWDKRCETEAQGYPVCGIANHKSYNDVDWYAHQNVDLTVFSQMFAESLFGGGEDLPKSRISIVAMDVPESSYAYDAKSLAKTNYEYAQEGWMLSPNGHADYDHSQITVDGYTAYYYHYYSSDPIWKVREAAYDVYVQHDGIIFWMVISISTPIDDKIPDSTIQDMIRSIDIK